ncbi:MAG: type II toxin-antitoxin system PemK/MazF family toxin [Balneolales bacterium]|nr:type II toxin-antitoxin system PemK/MazF family toxin [Balneolales bacterium]
MKQGEIWLINVDPTVGAEIKKTRPAIIVNNNALGKLPLKIIVPITDWKDRYETAIWMTKLKPDKENGLTKVSAADSFQVRSVSQERILKQIGTVSETIMNEIRIGLAKVLSIESE